jgi:hypothetical protein
MDPASHESNRTTVERPATHQARRIVDLFDEHMTNRVAV